MLASPKRTHQSELSPCRENRDAGVRVGAVTYRSILLNLDIDRHNNSLVRLAVDLAKRFDARLIGLAAADVPPPMASADGMVFDGELIECEREDIEARFAELRAKVENFAGTTVELEWREALALPTRSVTEAARAADLIVTSSPDTSSSINAYRSTDIGSLVLNAGRPVLVAAGEATQLVGEKAVVAWKDTREARRAVADALPLLLRAQEVVVVTVEQMEGMVPSVGVDDVAAFLMRHGVKARSEVTAGEDESKALSAFARSIHADLIVSGAYGHSRLREWIFGGVTRSLLEDKELNRFMSS